MPDSDRNLAETLKSTSSETILVMTQPDDWHLHLRDGEMLAQVLPYTAAQFGRAIVMPNLEHPIVTSGMAAAYRQRIRQAHPGGHFEPLMTAYLTETTDPNDIERGHTQKIWVAGKLYPAHATTNSSHGVTDMKKIYPVLERMEKIGMPLLVHGEVTDPAIDIFDREAVFIDRVLIRLLDDFPGLKVVMEHITTAQAVDFILSAREGVGATITLHHLKINRNAIFAGGIRPHMYCLPVAKREGHRRALRRAATSGNPRFFLGTDSAPHRVGAKIAACGCAGICNVIGAVEGYAEVFEEEGALNNLEAFASFNGPDFYGLPRNQRKMKLLREELEIPKEIGSGVNGVIPFRAGEKLSMRAVLHEPHICY